MDDVARWTAFVLGVMLFVAAIKSGEDFTEEDLEAEAAIQAFEEENCGSEE